MSDEQLKEGAPIPSIGYCEGQVLSFGEAFAFAIPTAKALDGLKIGEKLPTSPAVGIFYVPKHVVERDTSDDRTEKVREARVIFCAVNPYGAVKASEARVVNRGTTSEMIQVNTPTMRNYVDYSGYVPGWEQLNDAVRSQIPNAVSFPPEVTQDLNLGMIEGSQDVGPSGGIREFKEGIRRLTGVNAITVLFFPNADAYNACREKVVESMIKSDYDALEAALLDAQVYGRQTLIGEAQKLIPPIIIN